MLPEVKVPKHLVRLSKAARDALSDEIAIRGQERVYAATAERRAEWEVLCAVAGKRKEKTEKTYERALKRFVGTID